MKRFWNEKSMVYGPWSMAVQNLPLTINYGLWMAVLIIMISCADKKKETAAVDKYTCPMHPQIVQDKPDTCPICGMDLVLVNSMSGDSSITLNESQIKLANITTTPTSYSDIGVTTIVTGKIKVNEDQTEVVSTRVSGRLDRLFIKETGKSVGKGQPLYEIYSEQLQTLQQEYLLAVRQYEELKQQRYETFVKSAERKLNLLGMTKAQIDQLAKDKRASSRVTFVSPVSGVVADIDAVEGQYVSEGSKLLRIEKLDQLWVEGELYPNEASLVKMGDNIKIKAEGFEKAMEGKVSFLGPEYRQNTQITVVRVLIQNPRQELIPGMQANLLLTKPGKKAIAVPVDAIVRDEKGSRLWVADEMGAYHLRWVKTGAENSEQVEILEGVEEDENVVVTGSYLLYSELVLKKDRNNN